MNAGPFDHFTVLIKKFYKMTSLRFLTRMHETVENMKGALGSVQRPSREGYGGVSGAPILRKNKCVEEGGGYPVSDGLCLVWGETFQEVERASAAVPVGPLLGGLQVELFNEGQLALFLSCVKERMGLGGVLVATGNLRMVFVKAGLIRGGLFSSFADHSGALSIPRAWRAELCGLREQSVFADQASRAHKMMLKSFVAIREERDKKKKLRARNVLLLFRCLMNGGSEARELAFLEYIECVPSFGEGDELLRCVCLQQTTAGSR